MDDFFYFQYVLAKRLFTSVLKSTRSLGNFEMRQWRVTLRVHLLNLTTMIRVATDIGAN